MKYSMKFRIWHWLNAIVVVLLLATVFLRKTFLSWRTNSEIIVNQLSSIGVDITSVQAKVIAKAIRSGMWEWHIILGYMLMFLIVYRIYLFYKDDSKIDTFSSLNMHKKMVRISYFIFYGVILFMSISGFSIYFHTAIGLSDEFAHDIKEIHEAVYPVIYIFVLLHISGVVIAENRDEKGIVSSMINGEKPQ